MNIVTNNIQIQSISHKSMKHIYTQTIFAKHYHNITNSFVHPITIF